MQQDRLHDPLLLLNQNVRQNTDRCQRHIVALTKIFLLASQLLCHLHLHRSYAPTLASLLHRGHVVLSLLIFLPPTAECRLASDRACTVSHMS